MARPPSTDQYLPSQGKYSSPPLLLDPVFRDSSTSPPYLPSGSYPDLPLITDELKSSIKPAGAPTKRSGGETEESERERRKKRPRQVLSCTMCVKRKTKCDKSVPCAACVKRGDPALCVVEGVDESTPRQPFALSEDMTLVKSRITWLEDTVQRLVAASSLPNLSASGGQGAAELESRLAGEDMKRTNAGLGGGMAVGAGGAASGRRESGETTEAAVAEALQRLSEGNLGMIDAPLLHLSPHVGSSAPVAAVGKSSASKRYAKDLAKLVELMPPRRVSDLLVESFVKRVDWHLHVLHLPMFRAECVAAWDKVDSGNASTLSPSWLATYFMVISLGLYYLPMTLSPYPNEETLDLPVEWRDLSEKAMSLSDWSGKPQARNVQAILLMAFFWYNIGEIDRLVVWVGAGVRIAQSLGLHTVDKKPAQFVNDVFAVPASHLAFFSQELGTRLWWYLCVFDWDVSYRCRNMSVLRAQDFSTPTPLNLSDDDIVKGPKLPKDLQIATITNYEILLSELVFLQQQWVVPRKTPAGLAVLPLETIISIDKLVREKATRFADFFQIEKSSENKVVQTDASKPYIVLQRLNLNMEIQCRLLRLHRRCLFDNSQSPEALFSIKASRQSSSFLLQIAHLFFQNCDFAPKIWWIGAYAILACVNIILSNIHLSSLPLPIPSDVLTRRLEVNATILELKASSPLMAHTAAGIRVVEALLVEETNAAKLNPKIPFDATRYRRLLDAVAKAGIACSAAETAQMNQLADDLTRLLPPNPALPRVAPINFDELDLSLPLVGGGDFSAPSTDYDEFFRSLGFVAPPGGFELGEGDLFGDSGYGGNSAPGLGAWQ